MEDRGSIVLPSMDELLRALPKEIYEMSSRKAAARLTLSILTISLGVVMLAIFPWYLLPIGWVFMGTAITGLFTVGYSCGQNSFFKNRMVNYLVGTLCMLPLMYPLEYWKSYTKDAFSFPRLANSPFWFLSSMFQWASSNFTFDFSRRMVVSAFFLYVFAAIFFPLVTYGVGLWGLFKFYFIPLLVYHFWMSTFLKANVVSLLNESPIFWRFPSWVQFLSNDFNYGMAMVQHCSAKLVPTYKWQDAYLSLKKECGQSLQELSFVYLILTKKFDNKTSAKVERAEPAFVETVGRLFSEINWPTTLFLTITPLLGLYGVFTVPFNWKTYALAFACYYIAGIGITAGYHRLFSHRSYNASWPVKFVLVVMGTTAFEMSVLDWCADHRAHHRYTDTDKDPYNVKKGFLWAHMGWLMFNREDTPHSDINDLKRDWLLRFQHKYFFPLSAMLGFALPTFIAGYYWGDWMGGFLISGVLSKVVMLHCTFCINSLAHYIGDATYSDQRSPRDSAITSLVTFGEGYHNFHHEFPYDYRNGIQATAYDPGKWLIYALSLVGLTYNLKRFPDELFDKGKLQMAQKRLDKKKANHFWGIPVEDLPVVTQEYIKKKKVLVIEDIVYDVSEFADTHPGGKKILETYIGKDATEAFNGGVYNHSYAARNILDTLRIAKTR